MTEQPVPRVTAADVERIVRREFPADRVAEVLTLLGEYGAEAHHHEPDRVRLAALKLAAGDVDRLRGRIETAKRDYRDVLAQAEYPGYSGRSPGARALSPEERRAIVDADWRQYRDWLGR